MLFKTGINVCFFCSNDAKVKEKIPNLKGSGKAKCHQNRPLADIRVC
jgi:hypothetical protein